MWRTIGRSFAAVFVAELGDKTQLATLALAGDAQSRWAVFVGSAAALVLSSLIAVLAGGALAKALPPVWLQRGAGVLFLVLGGWTLWKSTLGAG